jgi:uncharacterized protein with HEPN domain
MKDNRIYVIHIRDCIARIEEFTLDGKAAFLADIKTQDAVLRNLQTMCESTQRLPTDWKAAFPEMDWQGIGDFRNVLTHQYLEIDLDVVWDIIENYLPNLKTTMDEIAEIFWNS